MTQKSSEYVIKAVRPVGFLAGLFQLVAKILFGGLAATLVLIMMILTITVVQATLFSTTEETVDMPYSGETTAGSRKNKLLIINLRGPILGTSPFDNPHPLMAAFNLTFGYTLHDDILEAAKDENIKGILIHTTTPGGTIFGSSAINEAIRTYRETTNKPVVVWVEGISASGGIYSTANASSIYAAPGSSIGAIGVIAGARIYYDTPMKIGAVETKNGIKVEYPHAGRGKDGGNPFRERTDLERKIADEGLNASYKQFVQVVSEGRGIPADDVVERIGAHIYGNAQAEELGLIDGTLGRDEAFAALAKEAGLKEGEYMMVRRGAARQRVFDRLISAMGLDFDPVGAKAEELVKKSRCDAAGQSVLVYHGDVPELCAS